jgi:hypothetical protein
MGTLQEALRKAGLVSPEQDAAVDQVDAVIAETNQHHQVLKHGFDSDALQSGGTLPEPPNFHFRPRGNYLVESDADAYYRRTRDTHGGKARLDSDKHGRKRFKPRQGGGHIRKW